MTLVLLLCCLLVSSSVSLTALVRGKDEECFFEETKAGEKIHGSFGVTAGDVDLTVSVYDPQDKAILKLTQSVEDSFTFMSLLDGFYTVCFLNNKNDISTVDFNLHYGDSLKIKNIVKEDHITPIEEAVNSLQEGIDELNEQIRYYNNRLLRHRQTTQSTQSRLTMWTFIESGILICVGLLQTWIITNLFEKKRKI